ncbi:hypothetical protein [Tautonia plasticadhaerens]|uniref:Uncharacterized protein n=1 Tax=Tautonia plasticadhaerens TaxID=2527974 RepID=A0A518H2G6_9BACT|nr:hypothetical protein [Tautonia plasticadhaerens]QDV34997.1 hypothetical protein ElP_28940 [Tautonia plasticadhaerens]
MKRSAMILFVLATLATAAPARADFWGKLVKESGEFISNKLGRSADDAARFAARHGDDAARGFSRNADDIAGVAGGTASHLSARSVRRLEALRTSGHPGASGLAGVVEAYGDPAMDFIYRHRGTLAGTAALTAFLANPEPYLNGVETLAAPPLTRLSDGVVSVFDSLGWVLIILSFGGAAAVFHHYKQKLREGQTTEKEGVHP